MKYTGERIHPQLSGKMFPRHIIAYKYGLDLIGRCGGNASTVLDYGCGEGYGTYCLAAAGYKVIGTDINNTAVKGASEKYQLPNLKFCRLNEFGREKFDFIVCLQVIEHVDKPEELIACLSQMLNNQGLLLISTPNRKTNADMGFISQYHVKEYDCFEMRNLLGKYFKIHNTLGLKGNYKVQISRLFDRWQNIIDKSHSSLLVKVIGTFVYLGWKHIVPSRYSENDYYISSGNDDGFLDLLFVCLKKQNNLQLLPGIPQLF